ncbi:hypothetical protein MMC26_004329 [Xylographa opegraphella]|nr:hypothetical protein [Xylographa opegraphella]
MGTAAVIGPAAAVAAAGNAVAGAVGLPTLGAGVLAPLVAPALAMGAAGPLGWVAMAGGLLSGVVIVAGDAEMRQRCCWEDVLRINEPDLKPESAFDGPEAAPLSESQIGFHRQNGMLLQDLAARCEVMKTVEAGDEPDRLVLKNPYGD